MWFIGVEVEQETSAPPPKKNPGSAPEGKHQKCGWGGKVALEMWSTEKKKKEREKVFFMIERVGLPEDDFEYEIFSILSIARA